MDQRKKPRLRFAERIGELHEQDAEESGQFVALLRSIFLPGLIVAGLAIVVSVLAWLNNSLSGRLPLLAGGVAVVAIATFMLWRRSRLR